MKFFYLIKKNRYNSDIKTSWTKNDINDYLDDITQHLIQSNPNNKQLNLKLMKNDEEEL